MNQNPLLLATLFLKYQPAAKTFEEAVAMEVESIEKEKLTVEAELTELANKESALTMRVRELDAAKQALTDKPSAVANPISPEKEPVPTLFQIVTRKRRDRKARLRTRSGTTLTERRYMNCKYVEMARKRGVGTVESGEIVWLTKEEHGPVYADVCADRSNPAPVLPESKPEPALAPNVELAWSRNVGRGSEQKVRVRKETGELERSYTGHDYIYWARTANKGSPGIGCVYLTSQEAGAALKFRKSKEEKRAAAAK